MNDNISTNQPNPTEEYTFNYTTDELDKLFRLQRKQVYTTRIVCSIIFVFIIIYGIIIQPPQFISGFYVGCILFLIISYAKGIYIFNKTWKISKPKITETTYEYKVYDKYFILNLYYNGERTRQSKCYFEEIQKIHKFGKWLLLQFGGQSFILRESDLKENSVFLTYVQKNPKNKK